MPQRNQLVLKTTALRKIQKGTSTLTVVPSLIPWTTCERCDKRGYLKVDCTSSTKLPKSKQSSTAMAEPDDNLGSKATTTSAVTARTFSQRDVCIGDPHALQYMRVSRENVKFQVCLEPPLENSSKGYEKLDAVSESENVEDVHYMFHVVACVPTSECHLFLLNKAAKKERLWISYR